MNVRKLIKNRHVTVTIAWLCLVISAPLIVRAATQTEITRATLKNGLRVVIVRNALAPVVTTEINYLVGSNEAPDGFPGMAHALEHMMFRGSPGLSAAQTSTLIAAMGGSFNAATQQVVTQYFFTVPATDLETALHIEAIRMRDVLATDALWKQERGAIEQEVAQDYSNPEYLILFALAGADVRRHTIRARRSRHASFVSKNHRRDAQRFSSKVVCAEQRDSSDRRRRES